MLLKVNLKGYLAHKKTSEVLLPGTLQQAYAWGLEKILGGGHFHDSEVPLPECSTRSRTAGLGGGAFSHLRVSHATQHVPL